MRTGWGSAMFGDIEVVGEDIRGVNWHFAVGQSFHKFLGWLSWYGPTKALQKLVFRTPLVNIPILVSEVNHDYIHWPLIDRKKYLKWRAETSWGQLLIAMIRRSF